MGDWESESVTTEPLTIRGYVCASCNTRYAERSEICIRCWRTGVLVPDYQRRTDSFVPAARRFTARELAAQDQGVFSIPAYVALQVQTNAFVILHGAAGSGKSTMLLRIAESLQPSAFLAAEMKCGPSLAAYLRRLEIRAEKMTIFDPRSTREIFDVAASGIRCMVVDSLSVLSLIPDDLTGMASGNNIIVVGVLQETKQGLAAGPNAWLHAADVVVRCDKMKWTLEKSRYQTMEGVSGDVL